MRQIILPILVIIIAAHAHAQVYKCSKNGATVFSDVPCAPNAQTVKTTGNGAPTPSAQNPKLLGEDLCRFESFKHVAFKDPGSVQVGKIIDGNMLVIDYKGSPITARRYYVHINAKNSYGGYVGERPLACYTSEDGKRILMVDDILL